MRRGIFVAAAMTALLSACASPGRWQDRTKAHVQEQINTGRFFLAARELVDLDRAIPNETPKLWSALSADSVRSQLSGQGLAFISDQGWLGEPAVDQTLSTVSVLEQRKLISPEDAENLRNALFDKVIPSVIESTLVYSPDFVRKLPHGRSAGLYEARYFQVKKRVVEAQKANPLPSGYASDVEIMADSALALGPRSAIHSDFVALLPTLKLSTTQATSGLVGTHFGEASGKALSARRGKVFIQTIPDDPLLTADLSAAIASKLPLATFVDRAEGAMPLTIRKLRHEERSHPERTETVTIAQHEVNLAAAILVMPRNASFLYERRTGGAELEYAYEVKAGMDAPAIFRGTIVQTYRTCVNSRIVNVYGGILPANFIANDRMAADCGGTAVSVSTSAMRKDFESQLADWIANRESLARMR